MNETPTGLAGQSRDLRIDGDEVCPASGSIAEGNAETFALGSLRGKTAAVVVFSHYPSDPRPRRAAEALVQEGMRVEVISLSQNEGEPARETFNGVSILRIPLKNRRGGKLAYIFQYGAFIALSTLVLAFRCLTRRYSIVHVHNMPDVLVFAALVPKLCGAKVVLDLHDPMPELMMTIFGLNQDSRAVVWLRRFEKWSIALADLVLTPNAAFRRLFSGRSCPAEKLHVIMNAPDEKIFRWTETPKIAERADPARPYVVMYHGALVERHGLDLAVSAIAQLRHSIPGIELRVYGRQTPFVQRVMEDVRTRGLEQFVKYFGGRSLDQIAAAIDECDLGIIPNRRSVFTDINLPTRIFEYLTRGKPVIAPGSEGIRDYFDPGDLLFFELGDAQDLARQIEYAFQHPHEMAGMVRRGQATSSAHRWGQERKRFVALIAGLLGNSKEARRRSALSPVQANHV